MHVFDTLLAINTLGKEGSVALYQQGTMTTRTISHSKHVNSTIHAVRSMVKDVALDWSQLDLIVADVGPASLTGVRVGLATCQGLALPHNTPIWPCGHLKILAYQAYLTHKDQYKTSIPTFWVAEDARMHSIALAAYQLDYTSQTLEEINSIEILKPQNFVLRAPKKENIQVGQGWQDYTDEFAKDTISQLTKVQGEETRRQGPNLAETMLHMAIVEREVVCLSTITAQHLVAHYLRPPA